MKNEPRNHSSDSRHRPPQRRGAIVAAASGQLPGWVRDEVNRSTPKERREPALRLLSQGVAEFSDERYRAAAARLREAKALSPRAATIRELLGLSAYRAELWEEALRELRTFRRLTGDTSQMPAEMDALRALGRPADVDKTWQLFKELGGARDVELEARVVYASHLLDQGKVKPAWEVIKPGRLVASAGEAEIRSWYVAAKVALAAGDRETARTITNAISKQAPSLEGLEELQTSVGP
jgi:hypothetical protein